MGVKNVFKDIRYAKLIEYLKSLGSVVVAYSGGVDSTFLLKACEEALGDKAIALTVVSPYIPKWEIEEAKEFIKDIKVRHEFLEIPYVLEEIKFNPSDRCYLCKKAIFTMITDKAKEQGASFVLDGTNADDLGDYRPGLRALSELKVKSPLLECGLTKADIRELSKNLELPTWDKPAYACLLSRIPYGEELKFEEFDKIEKSEKYLMDLGFRAVRVRTHKDVARIEVPKDHIKRFFDEELLEQVAQKLKSFGFKYVSLDMEGYSMGSLNRELAIRE
jgi:uncharacterized protein